MIEELVGEKVVVDLRSSFVCLVTLEQFEEHFLKLKHADLHDLRDTKTTREIGVGFCWSERRSSRFRALKMSASTEPRLDSRGLGAYPDGSGSCSIADQGRGSHRDHSTRDDD